MVLDEIWEASSVVWQNDAEHARVKIEQLVERDPSYEELMRAGSVYDIFNLWRRTKDGESVSHDG